MQNYRNAVFEINRLEGLCFCLVDPALFLETDNDKGWGRIKQTYYAYCTETVFRIFVQGIFNTQIWKTLNKIFSLSKSYFSTLRKLLIPPPPDTPPKIAIKQTLYTFLYFHCPLLEYCLLSSILLYTQYLS